MTRPRPEQQPELPVELPLFADQRLIGGDGGRRVGEESCAATRTAVLSQVHALLSELSTRQGRK